VAPARANSAPGVTGIHISSQTSIPMMRPGTSSAWNNRSVPKGAHIAPTEISKPTASLPEPK
jgi:hypothetical protein